MVSIDACRLRRRGSRRFIRYLPYCCIEPVPSFRKSLNIRFPIRALPQALAQNKNVFREIALFHENACPDSIQQGLLIKHTPPILYQEQKQVETLRGQRNDLASTRQQPVGDIDLVGVKLID